MSEDENEKLSQDEIDALLGGVESGDIAVEDDSADNEARDYDFAAQERIVSARMAGLNAINERFIRNFRTSLMNLLRQHINVEVEDVRTLHCSEYFSAQPVPSCINIVRIRPLQGSSVIIFDQQLVFTLVDNLFGGGSLPRNESQERTEFTQMEMRIVSMVLDLIFQDLTIAWQTIYEIKPEYIGSEINPQLTNIAGPSEVVIVKRFKIELDDGVYGSLHIAIPYAALEPIRSTLEEGAASEYEEINEKWAGALREEIFDANIELEGTIAEKEVLYQDLIAFNEGDIIPLELNEFVTVRAAGIPTFRAKYGASQGNAAIKVVSRVGRK